MTGNGWTPSVSFIELPQSVEYSKMICIVFQSFKHGRHANIPALYVHIILKLLVLLVFIWLLCVPEQVRGIFMT